MAGICRPAQRISSRCLMPLERTPQRPERVTHHYGQRPASLRTHSQVRHTNGTYLPSCLRFKQGAVCLEAQVSALERIVDEVEINVV